MKTINFKLIKFLIPIIILLYPLDIFISYHLKNTHYEDEAGEYEVWNDIYNSKINADILIYGSSRAWVHFNSNIISKKLNKRCYNLGIDGQNFNLQYLRHLEYLKFNNKPKTIIFSLDVLTFKRKTELYNYNQFLPYMLYNKNIYNFTKNLKAFNWLDYHIPLIRYFSKSDAFINIIDSKINSKKDNIRVFGYAGINKKWVNKKEKLIPFNIDIDNQLYKLFNKFIKECRNNNIELILVYSPEFKDLDEVILNNKEIKELYIYISKKHKLKYLDYSNNTICNNKLYFYNSLHLNKLGSDIFTKKLIRDLK